MYNRKVLDHFRKPHNFGKMKNPDGVGKVGNVVCVVPKTRILTNWAIKNINELSKNDRVLSHDGAYHQIKNIYSRHVNEKIIFIKNKFGETFLTRDHLILSAKIPKTWYFSFTKNKKRFTQNLQWHHAEDLEEKDILAYPFSNEIKDINEITADIKKSKWDFKSKDIPAKIKIDNDFLRLAGYYLSEGYIQDKVSNKRLGFSFNSNESIYIQDVELIIKKIFGLKTKINLVSGNQRADIYVNSVFLVRLFKKLFGKGAENKKIPSFMLFLPLDKQKSLIAGMWRGDGYFSTQRICPRAGYTTISFYLAQQLKTLLLRQGIIPSIYKEEVKITKGVNHQKSYRIHIGERTSLIKLAEILGVNFRNNKEVHVRTWIENGFVFLPITKIKKINHQGEVYNLEVEESHSFVADSACLHNCGDLMWLYFKVGKDKKGQEIIKDVKFETFGCVAAIATSSIITDLAKGKTLTKALDINKETVVKALGALPPVKLHCSVLAADALAEAIYDYLKKNKRKIPADLEKRHQRIDNEEKLIREKYKGWIDQEEKLHQ